MSANQLNYFGQFMGYMGIPIHARNFAKSLNNIIDINLFQILPFNEEDIYSIPPELISKLKTHSPIQKAVNFSNRKLPSLIFWYPNSMIECSQILNIGYFIFEYTIIPKEFVDKLNTMDIVCTASKWGASILENNGVRSKCVNIPAGIDPIIFNSKNRVLDNKVFKFLHIGKAENRKNTKLVILAFNEAFKGDNDIRLTLSIDNPHVRFFDAEAMLYEMYGSDELKYPINNIDIVHFISDIRDLYNTHHIGVYPSMAEGVGLPIIESMACGMPVIIPYNSGITEYANDDNCVLLKDLKTIPVYDQYFFPVSGQYGTWESPSLEELIQKMKICYEHYPEIKLIGKTAETYMREEYNWSIASNKFMELL